VRPAFIASPATAALLAVALVTAGCTSRGGLFSGDTIDYQSGATQTRGLDVPPDLTQLARDGRYQAPGGVVSAAAAAAGPSPATPSAAATVAPAAIGDLRIQRDGNMRWLQVPMPPEQLWPQLRAFWIDAGFELQIDNAAVGVIETAWAENRAKLPQDFLRATLGRVLDGLYDTGERDRFRTRIERTATGTDVYITHRGLEQVVSGPQQEVVRWAVRPADPQLEAEFLSRLMLRLGNDAATTQVALAAPAAAAAPRARLLTGQTTAALEVDDEFDRAWRRVGLALDRTGFTVEDRNRSEGLYFVRYVDSKAPDERGFLGRLFGGDEAAQARRYRIALLGGTAATGGRTIVAVQDAEGGAVEGSTGERIASVLLAELK
jgi:outer membrane protein assembly factor BamC